MAVHDKGDGNPHAHIMLTMRPFKEDGSWDAKCLKEYDLDKYGQRIRLKSGAFKSHRVDTTDWNEPTKAEKWREAWADYANGALAQKGLSERIDHRSYKRQGVEQIPTVHMGVATIQMERRGIPTEKGSANREVTAQNKLLKEIKARLTRLYNWSKEQAAQPGIKRSVLEQLRQARNEIQATPTYGKTRARNEDVALFNLLQERKISSILIPLHTFVTVLRAFSMPRMSKKRRLEWTFFLNHRNRITYNELCRKCVHMCKQSFRTEVMVCPRYQSKRAKEDCHES